MPYFAPVVLPKANLRQTLTGRGSLMPFSPLKPFGVNQHCKNTGTASVKHNTHMFIFMFVCIYPHFMYVETMNVSQLDALYFY